MDEQQHDHYDRSSKEIDDIKTTLKTMSESVKASVGQHLEARIEVLNREIQTLIDDTHKVGLSLLSLLLPLSSSLSLSLSLLSLLS